MKESRVRCLLENNDWELDYSGQVISHGESWQLTNCIIQQTAMNLNTSQPRFYHSHLSINHPNTTGHI